MVTHELFCASRRYFEDAEAEEGAAVQTTAGSIAALADSFIVVCTFCYLCNGSIGEVIEVMSLGSWFAGSLSMGD